MLTQLQIYNDVDRTILNVMQDHYRVTILLFPWFVVIEYRHMSH